MFVKKYKGKVFGVDLTNAEREALRMECEKQMLEMVDEYGTDFDAMVLYVLHVQFGFGKKRLWEFWNAFRDKHKELRERYMMPSQRENAWLAHRKLAEIGVDVRAWEKKENEHA